MRAAQNWLSVTWRKVVRYIGTSRVRAMELALRCAHPQAARIVAAECGVLAETKDHFNWEAPVFVKGISQHRHWEREVAL